jgi:MFS family permease
LTSLPPPRLLGLNALIRIAAAASGQLFAFVLAERLGGRIGTGATLVGLIGACYFAVELLGAPLAGRAADRVGQRRVLRYGPVFGALSALVATAVVFEAGGVAALAGVLLVARLTEGLSAACAVPTTLVLLARATDGDARRRMRVMGAFEISSLLGMIAGFVLGGIGWDAAGIGAFLLLAPLYGAAWLLVGRPRAGEGAASALAPLAGTLRSLARERGNIAFGVAWLAVNAVVGVWIQQAPYLLKLPQRLATQTLVGGLSGRDIGLIFGAWGLIFLAGLVAWSLWGGLWPRQRTLAIALGGMLGVVATLAWINHGAPRLALALASAFIFVESGFAPAAFAHLADLTERLDASRGAALGLYSLLLAGGQLLGNVLGAPFAARWQMDGVLLFTGLAAVVALGGVAVMRARPSSVREPAVQRTTD